MAEESYTEEQKRFMSICRQSSDKRDIEADLGRRLTRSEDLIFRRVRNAIRRKKNRDRENGLIDNSSVRVERFLVARRTIARLPLPKEKEIRRRLLESKPERWLKHYFPNLFPLPFSDGHREIIDSAIKSDLEGGNIVVAAPRGEGKTTILRALCIYLVFTHRSRFVVMGGWQNRSAKETFSQWKFAIENEILASDYPEFLLPFQQSLNSTRVRAMLWSDTGRPTGADIKADKMCIVFPDGLGALATGSVNGDIKGLNVSVSTGEVLRPDKLLLDDPQDVTRAGDQVFVESVISNLDSQWMCLAGPTKRISMMAAVTIKARDDVGDTLGHRPGTRFVRISRVKKWPEGFLDKASANRSMWNAWYELYSDTDERPQAVRFYRKNKAEMTKGMEVSWRERFDKAKGDPDAFYSAMVDFYRLGEEAFASEYQNHPLEIDASAYILTPHQVTVHKEERPFGVIPENAAYTVAALDINPSYGFTIEACSFFKDHHSAVVFHSIWCKPPLPIHENETTQDERAISVRLALTNACKDISGQPWRPDFLAVDCGGEHFQTVTAFSHDSEALSGIKAWAITGRAGKTYNPMVRTRVGAARAKVYQCRDGRDMWLCFDADYYKEIAQRSFLSRVGAIGSSSLPDYPMMEYADQLCRERIAWKGEHNGRLVYEWDTLPGKHDFLDCHAMCMAVAGYQGYGFDVTAGSSGGSGYNRRKVYCA